MGKFVKLYIFSVCNANKNFWEKHLKPECWSSLLTQTFLYTSCQQDFIKHFFVINKGQGLLQLIEKKRKSIPCFDLNPQPGGKIDEKKVILSEYQKDHDSNIYYVLYGYSWEGHPMLVQEKMDFSSLKGYIDFSQ